MLLDEIKNGTQAFLHMERYVNSGSPSGFTEIYTTSSATSPIGQAEEFWLSAITVPSSVKSVDFGNRPEFIRDWQMLIHPDMAADNLFRICTSITREAVRVSPTSSARTVLMLEHGGWFVKLCYKGLIGRVERHLGTQHALSAIEVTEGICRAMDAGRLKSGTYLLKEPFARVLYLPHENGFYEWGMVLREPKPYPNNPNIKYIVPGFSLFSKDKLYPSHPILLLQLFERQNKPIDQFLLEDILLPLFNTYFDLLEACGLQIEAHAQNTLLALDADFKVVGVVIRDAESVDKDISLMSHYSIQNTYTPTGYKSLERAQPTYFIMHSFMFDFKLGEYLITPIIEGAEMIRGFDRKHVVEAIKQHNRKRIERLPPFFPQDGLWYSYANIVHNRNLPRPYIANENPRYR